MSQVTSESILTTKEIVEQAITDYHAQILPYLNGEFPTAVAERFAEGNIYTTDEKIIGQWIDGKPLYQKTITGTTSSKSGDYYSIDVSDLDIEYLIRYDGFVRGYDQTAGKYFDYYIGTNGASVDYNVKEESYCWYHTTQKQIVISVRSVNNQLSRPFYLTIQYTKVGDEPVSFGTDTYYSTTEKIVGTWIDGKPIYQIVSSLPEAETDGALFKPMMTDNNVPSPYVVTSSDLYNGSMQPYKAFDNARYLNGDPDFTDGRDSYYWMTSQIAGSWIKIDLGENNAKEFVNVGLGGIGASYINDLPRSFTISGSNDDNDYTVLYTSDPDRENGASADAYLVETFEFERTGRYRYYKLDVNTAFAGSNVRIDCIKFYEAAQSIAPNIDKVLSKVHMGDMYVYQYTKTTD